LSKRYKKIAAVTGTRADYGIYTPLLKKIQDHKNFDLGVIVTGMHLSPNYDYTIEEIKKDGYRIIGTADILLQGSTPGNMSRSIGLGIMSMTHILEEYKPDLIFVLGDRVEMLAGSIAAACLNIPIAHLHGGEISGSIDETIRHSISKLAHIHFPATDISAQRLMKMGEEEWRIHKTGALRLDTILNADVPALENVSKKYNIEFLKRKQYYLLIYHPVTTEMDTMTIQIINIIKVLQNLLKKPLICILPNSDPGTEEILAVYKKIKGENIKFITNFSSSDYLTVLKNTIALIGNSSSGIIEAASYHIPVLNIGSRQEGREKGLNVVNAEPTIPSIEKGLMKIHDQNFQNEINRMINLYGDGAAGQRIIEVLEKLDPPKILLNKRMTY
jgi:GDP/UDP-N,N'-diacetylbacillosamine 2-epimerase (hydrolysing)